MPLTVIEEFANRLIERRKTDHNAVNHSFAQYAAAKFSTKDKSYDYRKLLPYPPQQKNVTNDTLVVLRELVDTGALPPKAHLAALNRLES